MNKQDKDMKDAVFDFVRDVELNGSAKISVSIKGGSILSEVGNHSFLADDNGTEATMVASAWVAGVLEEADDKDVDFTAQLTKDEKEQAIISIVHTPKQLMH